MNKLCGHIFFSLAKYLQMEMLGHRALGSTVGGAAKLLCKEATLMRAPVSSYPCPHLYFSFLSHLHGLR